MTPDQAERLIEAVESMRSFLGLIMLFVMYHVTYLALTRLLGDRKKEIEK